MDMAASAARHPAARLAKKKMAARKNELSRHDFQFHRRSSSPTGLRISSRSTPATETNSDPSVLAPKSDDNRGTLQAGECLVKKR